MNTNNIRCPISSLWISPEGKAHLTYLDGTERMDLSIGFEPFVWGNDAEDYQSCACDKISLKGNSEHSLNTIFRFPEKSTYEDFIKRHKKDLPILKLSSLENQFLLTNNFRMFEKCHFADIRRMQLDIETHSQYGFSNPSRHSDRIIAIGISCGDTKNIFEIEEFSDTAEADLLCKFVKAVQKINPDIIEGHNIFNFDLDYISKRASMLKVELKIGRYSQTPTCRKSRIKIAERTLDFLRFDIPGRTVVDTYLLLQLYDVSKRELASYSLKNAALHFGISKKENRTYIKGDEIKDIFNSDRKKFREYLRDDLRETKALSNILLPTYVAQTQNFPMTLQECLLRGSGMKVEYIFLEKYFHAKASLPDIPPSRFFAGAISESFEVGAFKNVLHYDVASLYPSIMVLLGKSPKNDYLRVFLEVLKELKEYRLKYKILAKTSTDADAKNEYDARQNSFKILINSFYGYLGLATARFGDSDLAEEVTAKGREILTSLINKFSELGCKILEADTDGIYLSADKYFEHPEKLLEEVQSVLPLGIELEFDGIYSAMLCYKAKNYALVEDGKLILKGSALRNRSMEPYLQKISTAIIEIALGLSKENLKSLIKQEKEKILNKDYNISELAKSEFLSVSPAAYQAQIEQTGKGRRAALEAALLMKVPPKSGDKVAYYISESSKKEADWKLAKPIELYDKNLAPYDVEHYLGKLDGICERFEEIIGSEKFPTEKPKQGELFSL